MNAEGNVESAKVLSSTKDQSVDSALAEAAAKCKFEPKYIITPSTGIKTNQTEFRELQVQWPVPVPTWGAHLCFSPEYPHALRESEAEGTVTVIARKPGANSIPELKLAAESSPRLALRRLTLDVVAACFANQRTHVDMPTERDYGYRYQWQLR